MQALRDVKKRSDTIASKSAPTRFVFQTLNTGTGLHQRSLYSRSARPNEKRKGLLRLRACSQADWVLIKLNTLPGLNSRV